MTIKHQKHFQISDILPDGYELTLLPIGAMSTTDNMALSLTNLFASTPSASVRLRPPADLKKLKHAASFIARPFRYALHILLLR